MPDSQSHKPHHKILIVEDDLMIREVFFDYLSDVGFEVLSAVNADEAQSILKGSGAIELVVTDINMPGSIDGAELSSWLQRFEPNMPVILISGKAAMPANSSGTEMVLEKAFRVGGRRGQNTAANGLRLCRFYPRGITFVSPGQE